MADVDFKADADTAFKAQEFSRAVELYSKAIEADSSNRVLFSNRSAAHAKLENYKDALLDANKCIALDPQWGRGHSRRGAAYVGLKNWPSALKAYETGLECEPTNENTKREIASIRARLSGSRTSTATPPVPGGAAVPGGAQGFSALNVAALLFTFLYFVPLLGPSRAFLVYRAALAASLASYAITLWRAWPKTWATLKDPRFQQAPETSFILLGFMMQISPPLPFALVPMACYALHHTCRVYYSSLVPKLPSFLKDRAIWITTEEGTHMLMAFAAISEVMVGVTAPITLLTHGTRVLAVSILYIQYLLNRYNNSHWTQLAVGALTEKADGAFHHRYCPSPVGAIYDRFKGGIASLAARLRG